MSLGWLYNGASAARREVRVEPSGDGLRLTYDDGWEEVDAASLTHSGMRGEREMYGRSDTPGWRLSLPKPIDPALAPILPEPRVYGGWIDRFGLWPTLVAGAVASALILFGVTQLPHLLVPLVPPSWDKQMGEALVGNLGGRFCERAEGSAALRKLTAQLTPNARELKVYVVDVPIVNAAALPGGNIVIFRELLTSATGPDEVAGVLAHEIAHVQKRHVTEAMIRHYGLGVLMSTLGGQTGTNVDRVMGLRYGRDSEREADEGALEALRRANISPAATAGFFRRLANQEAKLGLFSEGMAYISTHPLSGERERLFTHGVEKGRRYQPALNQADWYALADICWKKQKREP